MAVDYRLVLVIGFLHVLVAVAWVGQALTMTLLVNPVVRKATPASLGELMGRLGPASLKYGNVTGGLTLVTGLGYLFAKYGSFAAAGPYIGFGFIVTIALLVLLNYAVRPTLRRLGEMAAQRQHPNAPPSMQQTILQVRLAFTTRLMVALQLGVLGLMFYVAHG